MATNIPASLAVRISANTADFRKSLSETQQSLSTFNKTVGGIAKAAIGLFAADKLLEFGKEVFNVTAEFQKFEAVLTNTLGHNGAAQAALAQITEFAVKTPFQVNELTSSFVKLANQGFVPTLNEMKSLGDLASAMGKSFDQLTEAIIDAQTGEFERLKEFGIRAQKQGDKVTFTFKGVKKQVDFTADSIREYVLSLGDIQGVTGGMEAQSKTLGGTLSNLQDAFDQLKLSIGKLVEGDGVVSAFLNNLAAGAKAIADALGGPTREELEKTRAILEQVRSKAWAEKDMATWQRAREAWQLADERLRAMAEGEEKLAEIQTKKTIPAVKAETQSVKELMDQWDRGNSIFAKEFNPANEIKGKTGSDFLFDSGAMTEMANVGSGALAKLSEGLKMNANEWALWSAQVSVQTQMLAEKISIDFTPVIHNALSGIGQALGSAISGADSLGNGLLKVLGGVLTQLGEMLIAAGLGIEGFKASLKSLNGVVAIAAGVALIALGSAVGGSIKSLGSSAGSGGGSAGRSSSSVGGLSARGTEITLGGEVIIRGDDLVYIINRKNNQNNRTRRG